jgi:hypothetical protein
MGWQRFLQQLSQLEAMREQVRAMKVQVAEGISFYTALNRLLLSTIEGLAQVDAAYELASPVRSYVGALQASSGLH